jgi:hypothetical protein
VEDVKYFVLGGATNPYLLARVRWPDVAHAITKGCLTWLDDPGLFDLPYDPISARVSFDEASAIATDWGINLQSGAVIETARPLIRRMPANWSRLSRAEEQAWALEYVTTGLSANALRESSDGRDPRKSGRRSLLGRRRPEHAPAASSNGQNTTDVAATNGHKPPDRRRHARVPVGKPAQIRCGDKTVAANLMDVSEGGGRWLVFDPHAALEVGEQLDPSLVLEGDGFEVQVNLDVGGTVIWGNDTGLGAQVGVAFEQLSDKQVERVQHLLLSSGAERGS